MKPAAFPVLRATRLLDQVRERMPYKHYSLRTEQTCVQWVKLFVKWHGLRHPRDMGQPEDEACLSMLANERRVAASTPLHAHTGQPFDEQISEGQYRPQSVRRLATDLARNWRLHQPDAYGPCRLLDCRSQRPRVWPWTPQSRSSSL